DELVVVLALPYAEPCEEGHERNHRHDGDVVGRRGYLPELPPVLYEERQDAHERQRCDEPKQPATVGARPLYCHCHDSLSDCELQVSSSKFKVKNTRFQL